MRLSSVLIVSEEPSAGVTSAVFDGGYVPIVRDNLATVLRVLRDEHCSAIVIEMERARDVDALECALNARDVDADIPIVVLDDSEHGERTPIDYPGWGPVGASFVQAKDLESELREILPRRGSLEGMHQGQKQQSRVVNGRSGLQRGVGQ